MSFVDKMRKNSNDEKVPIFPTLLWLIKLFDGEKTLSDFVSYMQNQYGIQVTNDDQVKLQSYIDSIRGKVILDAQAINAFANDQETSLKIARAIWFTKIFPAILGLEFNLEDEDSIDSKFL